MRTSPHFLYEKKGQIAIMTWNREEAANCFTPEMIDLVECTSQTLGHSVRRMPSGAGHDAQMFAPNCPTAMIFVPSQNGISHNTREHTESADIQAGANVLLQAIVHQAQSPD